MSKTPGLQGFSRRWLTAGCWVYLTILVAWSVLYWMTGDQISYLALVNHLVVYLFVPLPLVLIAALYLRRLEIWLGCAFGLGVFIWHWGALFVPTIHRSVSGETPLVVMTYNVLGRHARTGPILETIRVANPDLVLIQELNPTLAGVLEGDLSGIYPYQVLDPKEGVTGMGVISRHPLRPTGDILPLEWVGGPQVLALEWENETVTVINFHMFPGGLGSPRGVDYVNRLREEQAGVLAEFARRAAQGGPVIAAGDANVTHLADAYRIVAADLKDSWREAGFGLGHTFPGSAIPGSSRPRIAGLPVPQWLARIDYIFHSAHWETWQAGLGRYDGVSDHRAVIAELVLRASARDQSGTP